MDDKILNNNGEVFNGRAQPVSSAIHLFVTNLFVQIRISPLGKTSELVC